MRVWPFLIQGATAFLGLKHPQCVDWQTAELGRHPIIQTLRKVEARVLQKPLQTWTLIRWLPHDTQAFTQGLWADGDLVYESTGLYGESSLRSWDPQTGNIHQYLEFPASVFAEGLARHPQGGLQVMTWRENQVWHVSDPFRLLGASPAFPTTRQEQWGLCTHGHYQIVTDGSSYLHVFQGKQLLKRIQVSANGQPISLLNDLDCKESSIYLNLWYSDLVIRLDPLDLSRDQVEVAQVLSLSVLRQFAQSAFTGLDVLNGITRFGESLFLTGKLWPYTFEIRVA